VDDVLDGAVDADGDVGVWEGCVAGVSAFADCPKIFDMMSPKIPMIPSLLDFDIPYSDHQPATPRRRPV